MRRTAAATNPTLALLLAPLALAGCVTTPAVSAGLKVDPDTRPACAANCETMGLRLAAVVLVRNSAGCVCAVPEGKAGARGEAAALAVAAGVVIDDDEAGAEMEPPPPRPAEPPAPVPAPPR
jgi:hypothetical protein